VKIRFASTLLIIHNFPTPWYRSESAFVISCAEANQLRLLVDDMRPDYEHRYFDIKDPSNSIAEMIDLLDNDLDNVRIRIELAYCYLQNYEEDSRR